MRAALPRPTIRLISVALAGTAALSAAGCSQPHMIAGAQPLESLIAAPRAAQWAALAPQAALLRLPDDRDAAIGLRERRQSHGGLHGVVQEIELPARGGTGRNLLTIALHGEAAEPGLYPGKPSQAGIRTEIAAAFPGRAFRVVVEPRRNAFGPYGLAVSVGPDGQRCVYAWQWLDRDDRRVAEALGAAASWRARICRKRESLDEIAAGLDQIAIGRQPDGIIVPEPVRAAPEKAARKPVPRTASVPPRIRAVEPASAWPAAAPGGQRYLAAIPAEARLPTTTGTPQAALDQSLPAEAYRGPSGRATPRIAQREGVPASRGLVPTPN